MKLARASIVLAALGAYLAAPFQLTRPAFWTSGLGDWMDPYFINYLLEHWYRSLVGVADPTSPPMFYPARGTLGYSHGLILYAPVYVLARLVWHPFQAYNLTILLVLALGTVCLYVVLRRFFRLTFIESALICAVFLASPNVTDGSLGVWSQRASVFLIPPILLAFLISRQSPTTRSSVVLAFASGLLGTLLLTQDFHTALFTLLLLTIGFAPLVLLASGPPRDALIRWWRSESLAARAAIVIAVGAAIWTAWLLTSGGGTLQVAGISVSTRDWRRPALITLVAGLGALWLQRGIRAHTFRQWTTPWRVAFGAGSLIGAILFLWIYLGTYREHHAFPETEILNALVVRDPSRWISVWAFVSDLRAYESWGPFVIVFALTILAWSAESADKTMRLSLLWISLASVVVLLLPLRIGGFSIWRAVFEPLPGFSAIRDPKRIIYVYELAVALTAAWFLARVRQPSLIRLATALLLLAVLLIQRHIPSFVILRPNVTFTRWVEQPIDVDPSCRSFYIKPASSDYATRPDSAWTVYHLDAMFVAFEHSLPTLNGYSAWAPPAWAIGDPQEPGYLDAVRQWIERNRLVGVCELDIERRTMRLTPSSH